MSAAAPGILLRPTAMMRNTPATSLRRNACARLLCLAALPLAMFPKEPACAAASVPGKWIDRYGLVTRHNVHLTKPDPLTPLSVGNGEFCFTADITGLQSFPEYYADGMYLSTQSQWGWHTTPDTGTHDPKDATARYEVDGRQVPYLSGEGSQRGYLPGATWLRANPHRQTLEHYRQLVFATADFMASYPAWDEPAQRFVLGPALIPAQESYGSTRRTNLNPTFELACWHWGLATAQRWRERLGLERNPRWDRVLAALSRPHVQDGVYTGIETPPFTIRRDHPSMVAALGFLPPTPLIDANIMARTFDDVLRTWDWPSTWGWDYPMLAMTAARLGRPEDAVNALFLDSPKNRFLANGHNYQSKRLPLYLPGNGGLLTAVAMMAAGWDGAPEEPAPGFPKNGPWRVRQEGLLRVP